MADMDVESVELKVSGVVVAYLEAIAFMERRVGEILAGAAAETLWLLEHPPLYTAGSSAQPDELLEPGRFPVFEAGRGGRYTYHGPGQRVGYVMVDLRKRGNDVRAFVGDLESWLIATLAKLGVRGERRQGRVGIWVDHGAHGGEKGGESKIAAIGVRIRHWITYHGVSINVCVDLDHFKGIVPCGISGHGVTSLKDLGIGAAMKDVDLALARSFEEVFARPLR